MAIPEPGAETRFRLSLLQSIRGYVGTWVDLLKTRLDLASTELEEESERLQHLLIMELISLLCLTLGALLMTFFVVVVFWETNYRLAVLGGFGLLYLGAGAVVLLLTRRQARNKPKLFSATLGELAKDYHRLSSGS
jgi:uncharacterized membrane protein YqjE